MKKVKDFSGILVIFGAPDTEEIAARKLVIGLGCNVATATAVDPKDTAATPRKVHPGNANFATGYTMDHGTHENITKVIIFECSKKLQSLFFVGVEIAICDHHNPGDFGFGLPPRRYWRASSLGQMCQILGVRPTKELRMVAAGDHCPAGAYAGKCPAIDVEDFKVFRTLKKSKELIEKAKSILLAAPIIDGVRDLRAMGEIDELPEAALQLGFAYIAQIADKDREYKPTGKLKILIGGHTTPASVQVFMDWANTLPNKVGPVYGDPIRGFAGVVIEKIS